MKHTMKPRMPLRRPRVPLCLSRNFNAILPLSVHHLRAPKITDVDVAEEVVAQALGGDSNSQMKSYGPTERVEPFVIFHLKERS